MVPLTELLSGQLQAKPVLVSTNCNILLHINNRCEVTNCSANNVLCSHKHVTNCWGFVKGLTHEHPIHVL